MKVVAHDLRLPGVRLLEFEPFRDDRGFFYESYHRATFAELGIDQVFVQDNHSRSVAGVLRGLHFQDASAPQWRLVRCPVGEIFDVVVDITAGSPTFGQWEGVSLSADNLRQLLVPPGYAHGFAVLSEVAEVQYKCSGHHDSSAERALDHADPDLAIAWPLTAPFVSAKDAAAPSWAEYVAAPAFVTGWDR